MEYLATVVFERTPAGAAAIKVSGDAVPRQLRTLLLAIDGRSPVSQYVSFLTALAPLSEKFAQLETMGFASRKGSASAPDTAPTAAATLTERELMELAQTLRRTAPATLPAGSAPSTALDLFEAQLQALAQQTAPFGDPTTASQVSAYAPAARPAAAHPPAPPTSTPALVARTDRPQLRDLLNEMQAYLSQAAGMEGLPVAVMLEQITSLAQLRAELPSYGELVSSYGGNASDHLRKLAALLEQAQR